MSLIWVLFLMLVTLLRFLENSITKGVNLIYFHSHNLKGMKSTFCSRIFYIITEYVKVKTKFKLFGKIEKLFLHILDIKNYFNDLYFPHAKHIWKLDIKIYFGTLLSWHIYFFTTLLMKYIPFFLFFINPAHTHSTFCSDFPYLFW